MLVLANSAGEKQQIKLKLADITGALNRADHKNELALDDGTLALSLEPFEVVRLSYTSK